MSNIRVRFAPSPTGSLHIGSLRTVLFNYLIAKSLGGKLILRIEDTDEKREIQGATESLIKILAWIGLKFDEGPHVEGDFGPYIQSQRLDIYKKYVNELLITGKAYYCFCSTERLQKMREDQQTKKQPPRYDRCCRNLSKEEVDKKIKQGETYVIRQKMPLNGEIIVYDELRGEIKFQNIDLEDQVLLKTDGRPTYQLASVIDDHLMEISHVLRGDEWLSSFPKNILLYQAFDWQAPKFIHLTLTLNKEGGKLSKRQGDVSVEDFQANGYLPEALLNFCVLQGWHPSTSKVAIADKKDEILSLEEMVKYFDYHNMGTSPSIFDIEKLDYFNGYYIRQMPIKKLTELCLPYLEQAGGIELIQNDNIKFKNKITGKEINLKYIKKVVVLEQERLKKLSEVGELTKFFFEDKLNYSQELLIWKKLTLEQIKINLQIIFELLEKIPNSEWTNDSIEEGIISYLKAKESKVGDYLWPMRVALTGRKDSPGPFDVAEVLGKEESLKRIKKGINGYISNENETPNLTFVH
ncbi:MAG: glutamate--tRNA ligase [Patescibacteria group bacterium]|nr:glutamate--tRNA ligase [Patescibacteria group bacterium]MBU0898005.1 glutamate--tRNA ligase [Patescibacteria group bacterium]MBU1062710.1 glutamate--tRNA ligase [Patescibacteria group bacterium]MBU2214645.1 glutamate--tRNA ligase [Patescibacteria group bacterium]